MCLRFSHVLECVTSHGVKVPRFGVHSAIGGVWACFQHREITTCTTVNNLKYASVLTGTPVSVGLSPEGEPPGHWMGICSTTKLTFQVFVASCRQPATPECSSGSVCQPTFGIICSYGLFSWCVCVCVCCFVLFCFSILVIVVRVCKQIPCVSFHCWLRTLRTFPKNIGHWDTLFCKVFALIFACLSKMLLPFSYWF